MELKWLVAMQLFIPLAILKYCNKNTVPSMKYRPIPLNTIAITILLNVERIKVAILGIGRHHAHAYKISLSFTMPLAILTAMHHNKTLTA